jgi:membrane fusion protein (multidrug efflux system)
VDVRNQDGKALAAAPRDGALIQTQVYTDLDKGAEAEVQRIIAANLGRDAAAHKPPPAGAKPGAPSSQAQPG